MPFEITYRFESDHVFAAIQGEPSLQEFLIALRQIGAASVNWQQRCVIVDLTQVRREYSFTEQLVIGQTVALNFKHLHRAAAVVQQERITRVGEKAARHSGASQVAVFASEREAVDWIRS